MKFIADAMLGSLAKRLRLLGHDVAYDASLGDNEVLRIALEQERVLLTRDTQLAARPLARGGVLITGSKVNDQLRQVLEAFPAPAPAPLTRCSACNGALLPISRDDARDRVPEQVLLTAARFLACPGCGRFYWEGTHVRNMGFPRTKKGPAP